MSAMQGTLAALAARHLRRTRIMADMVKNDDGVNQGEGDAHRDKTKYEKRGIMREMRLNPADLDRNGRVWMSHRYKERCQGKEKESREKQN